MNDAAESTDKESPIKLRMGDVLYEPLSNNTGVIIKMIDHPDGKLVRIRWRVEDHMPHDTEHLYKKVLRCVKKGEFEHSPKAKS